jgi:hypothetical protein
LSKLRKQLIAQAKLKLNARKKLFNKLKKASDQHHERSHQATSVKNALVLLTLVFKLEMSYLLLRPKSHHEASMSASRKNIDSTVTKPPTRTPCSS